MRHIILDCNNIGWISRHALGQELTYEDEETGIMWAFMRAVLGFAKQFNTNKFIFCWDGRSNARKKMYPEYKANRSKGTPEEEQTKHKIQKQFDTIKDDILPSMGFLNVFQFEGTEADDIMAWVVVNYDFPETPIVITTDKDMYQLLDRCDIYRPLKGDQKELVTKNVFVQRYDINPDEWVDVKSLEGDSGDNIPGIEGVGVKTAVKYLHGKLPVTAKAFEAIKSEEGHRIVERNKRLVSLPHPDCPEIPLLGHERFSLDHFMNMCTRYGFNSFLEFNTLQEWKHRFNMGG